LGASVVQGCEPDLAGFIPFEAEAANLFFELVSNRYERASLIVTRKKPFRPVGPSIRRVSENPTRIPAVPIRVTGG